MKISVAYGFAAALGMAMITMFVYYLGYHSDVTKIGAGEFIGSLGCVPIMIACIAAGIAAERGRLPPNSNFTYGEGVKTGALISLFTGLFGAVSFYVYTHIINPQYNDLVMQARLLSAKQGGATDAQLAQAKETYEAAMNPLLQAGMGIAMGMVLGMAITLIVALFFRRKVQAGRFAK